MLFQDIFYLELWLPFCLMEEEMPFEAFIDNWQWTSNDHNSLKGLKVIVA